VNQDPMGRQGFKYLDYGDMEVWVKPLENSELAFCFLNRDLEPSEITIDWQKFGIWEYGGRIKVDPDMKIHDLWKHEQVGDCQNPFTITVEGHDVVMVRLSK